MFKIHERLESDLLKLKESKDFIYMLMENSDNPWVVVIPKACDVKELHQLEISHQRKLWNEINRISLIFEEEFKPDKINIGSLGNIVPQLHIHIICRYKSDRAWPGSIWGAPLEKELSKVAQILEIIKEKI